MKEFVEKLLNELNYQKEYNQIVYDAKPRTEHEKDLNAVLQSTYDSAIRIVKRLAGEYERENLIGWIPCSERLPKEDMQCWATFESGNVDKIQYLASQKWWNCGCYRMATYCNLSAEMRVVMAEFESCDKCRYSIKSENEYPCNKCVHSATDKFKPKTRADVIRSMSDEELAEYLPIVFDLMCQPTDECMKIICNRGECTKTTECALKWLQSKAE